MFSFNVKNSSTQTIQFSISPLFKWKYSLVVKKSSNLAIQFSQTVLIQTIQFSISMQLRGYLWVKQNYPVLPFRARVDLGAMAMKGCSAFPKAPASLESHYQIV